MKHFLILMAAFLVFQNRLGAQDFVQDHEKLWMNERKSAQKKMSFSENPGYGNTDFIYQRMQWNVDPAVRFISGTVTSYFESLVDQLDSVLLDLDMNLVVDSVAGGNSLLNYAHTNNKLAVYLSSALSAGETDSIAVYYHGVPTKSGFGSFETSVHGSSQTPVMWTLSEPYGAMEWWPCKQSLSDKIDSIDIIVTTPENYRTASNGIVVSDTIIDGKRNTHWKHRFPIATYLVAIGVTNYESYSDTLQLNDGRVIDILNYVYPENLEKAKTQTPVTVEIMKLYNELIGEYPFASEKYGHAQFGWGGGMEHQTMSFMGGLGFHLISHELAHQWFGDYITTGSWQDIWLNEGFATYLTGLCYERIETDYWIPWKKQTTSQILSSEGGSVFVNDTTSVNRIFDSRLSYSKGAYLLHMLRWVLGDSTFFAGIRAYFNAPEVANGFATTRQFIQIMEEVADTTLSEFFDDWFYGQGYPVYQLDYTRLANHELKIKLSQTSSHASVDFFEMPVPVRVFNSDRSDSLDFRLQNTVNNQVFMIKPGFDVSEIQFDPDLWLVCKTAAVTSVDRIEENLIGISPNPVKEILKIQLDPHIDPEYIRIFDLKGSLVKSVDKESRELSVSDLPSGTYLLSITGKQGELHSKFVKQ